MPRSLGRRMVVASGAVALLFLWASGVALDRAFRHSTEVALQERLEGRIYALLAAAVVDPQGRMRLPTQLPEPRLSNPDSGLYAMVWGEDGYRWRSPSQLGRPFPELHPAPLNQFQLFPLEQGGERLWGLRYTLLWEDHQGTALRYHLVVAEEESSTTAVIHAFRVTLFGGLGVTALMLLLVQWLTVRWGLRPLREIAAEVAQMEAGGQRSLAGEYPSELLPLVRNLNHLIDYVERERERYRNSLGDLAHSLKTPLALLRNAAEQGATAPPLAVTVAEQVERMDGMVRYHLRRAHSGGRQPLLRHTPLLLPLQRLVATLEKVYHESGISATLATPEGLLVAMEEDDLFELLGNLLDNAFKYGHSQVRVEAGSGGEGAFWLEIEDDGAGIAPLDRQRLLRRGERGDQQRPGEGIGLGVVAEIVYLYHGSIQISESRWGGARVRVVL